MRNAAEGRVALVTGASQGGTGTVSAIRLAAEGAKVAITARSVDGLERTRAEIETLGGTALVLPCDLAARDGGRDTLVARTEADLGPVDILVNNAAAGGYRPLEDWAQDDLDRIMELNLYAPWLLMRQVLPGMRERGQGWIVNLTSFAGELSLQLLHELGEPVLDPHGERLVEGWQPVDLPARIARQAETMTETAGWPAPFTFRRPSSPDFTGS